MVYICYEENQEHTIAKEGLSSYFQIKSTWAKAMTWCHLRIDEAIEDGYILPDGTAGIDLINQMEDMFTRSEGLHEVQIDLVYASSNNQGDRYQINIIPVEIDSKPL